MRLLGIDGLLNYPVKVLLVLFHDVAGNSQGQGKFLASKIFTDVKNDPTRKDILEDFTGKV